MPARRFNEGDIDFDAIDADLAKLAAPKLRSAGCTESVACTPS